MKINKHSQKQLEILSYKLLHDALFLWVIVFAAFLVFETFLPGYLTMHIGFGKLIAAFFAIIVATAYLEKKNDFYSNTVAANKFLVNKLVFGLAFVSIILIAVSLRRFESFEIIIITIAAAATIYFLLKTFFEEE